MVAAAALRTAAEGGTVHHRPAVLSVPRTPECHTETPALNSFRVDGNVPVLHSAFASPSADHPVPPTGPAAAALTMGH